MEDPTQLNLDRLKEELSPVILETVNGLLSGDAADLSSYAEAICKDLLESSLVKDLEHERELRGALLDQLRVLAEIYRIRAGKKNWAMLAWVLQKVFQAATAGAIAAVAGQIKEG